MTKRLSCTLALTLLSSFARAQQPVDAAQAIQLPDAPQPQLVAEASSAESVPLQQAASTSAPAQPTPVQETQQQRAQRELDAEEKQRMLGVVPNFNTVMSGEAAPISSKQKFHLFFKSSVDPFQFVAAAIDSGIEQAENSYPEYHQGLKGFARRYGASFADGFDGNFFGNAALPSLLHQDPRYFRLGHGTVKQRIWYSIIANVRCKGDNGKWQPNYSNVAGNFIGGAISNLYYPASDRGVGLTLERGLTVTAEGAIGSLAVEFYPDVIQRYRNRHHKNAAPVAQSSPTP